MLTIVRPDACASASTLGLKAGDGPGLGSPSPPSALTTIHLSKESRPSRAARAAVAAIAATIRLRRSIIVIPQFGRSEGFVIGAGISSPALHRHPDAAKIADIGDRIGCQHDEIGELARRDRPCVGPLPRRFG